MGSWWDNSQQFYEIRQSFPPKEFGKLFFGYGTCHLHFTFCDRLFIFFTINCKFWEFFLWVTWNLSKNIFFRQFLFHLTVNWIFPELLQPILASVKKWNKILIPLLLFCYIKSDIWFKVIVLKTPSGIFSLLQITSILAKIMFLY